MQYTIQLYIHYKYTTIYYYAVHGTDAPNSVTNETNLICSVLNLQIATIRQSVQTAAFSGESKANTATDLLFSAAEKHMHNMCLLFNSACFREEC